MENIRLIRFDEKIVCDVTGRVYSDNEKGKNGLVYRDYEDRKNNWFYEEKYPELKDMHTFAIYDDMEILDKLEQHTKPFNRSDLLYCIKPCSLKWGSEKEREKSLEIRLIINESNGEINYLLNEEMAYFISHKFPYCGPSWS